MRSHAPFLLLLSAATAIGLATTICFAAQGSGAPAGPPTAAKGTKPPSGLPTGPLSIVSLTKPTKAGDDSITITYTHPPAAATKQVTAATGQTGTAHADDDIPKGMSTADKAKRYADAINEAAKDPSCGGNAHAPEVHAAVETAGPASQPTGHVKVTGVDGALISNVSVADNTGQQIKKSILPYGTHVDGDAPPEIEEDCMGSARFLGPIHGVNDDGEPAFASVGTDSYVSTLPTGAFLDVEDLLIALAADLAAHDVDAQIVNGEILVAVLHDGRAITAGTDDKGLTTLSAPGKLTP